MFGFLGRAYHTYKVEFGLTMLSSVEVTISNAFFLLILSVTGYSIYNVTSAVAGFLSA